MVCSPELRPSPAELAELCAGPLAKLSRRRRVSSELWRTRARRWPHAMVASSTERRLTSSGVPAAGDSDRLPPPPPTPV